MAFKTFRKAEYVLSCAGGKMNVITLCRITNFAPVMTPDLVKSAYDEYMHADTAFI